MRFGLVLDTIQALDEYVSGAAQVPWVPFNESGDWTAWLPRYENQTTKAGQETQGCTVWGSQNQVEMLSKFLYGKEPNYSERFTYLLTPVNPNKGADPHRTYECIRHEGLIDDRCLPMTNTLPEYLDISDITKSLRAKGQNWLYTTDFRHEWLKDTSLDSLKEALKTCPLGVSVTAWYESNGVYVDYGQPNNHWCVLYNIDDQGLHVFDSYDHSTKILSFSHTIKRAKRIWINERTRRSSRSMIELLKEVIQRLSMKPTLLQVAKDNLGNDLDPQNTVKDEVACSITVSRLIQKVDPEFKDITGTWTLWNTLRTSSKWEKVEQPEPGCVVISPTGTGVGIGHTGIVLDDGVIASNNSFGPYHGKFTENYTVVSWMSKYGARQRMSVEYYKLIS